MHCYSTLLSTEKILTLKPPCVHLGILNRKSGRNNSEYQKLSKYTVYICTVSLRIFKCNCRNS